MTIDEIKKSFGDQVVPDAKLADGCLAVVRPKDLSEAGRLVHFAGAGGCQLVPVGGRTKQHWLSPPKGPFVEMDMRSCDRVVEYSPNDMTVTVEAGITLASLSKVLAEHGQRVTLDPPHADRATIGGILAANDSGPIRLAFGTARDAVIGMSMIEPDGETIKSGGKVVKNVAGYDLHKLYIGSFGALGPIATVTFKLRPLPESRGLVVLRPTDTTEAERMIAAALAGPTRPTLIELVNARMARSLYMGNRLALVIGFEENTDAVTWQCRQIVSTLGGESFDPSESLFTYERLCEAAGAEAEASFKATMLSSAVAGFFERLERMPIRLIARAASGIVYGSAGDPLNVTVWRVIESEAAAGDGNVQIRGKLPELLSRFGRRRSDAALSDNIRKAFDPAGAFAPQRLS